MAILIISLSLVLGALLTRMVYNCYATTNAALTRQQAFFLAEAGLEKGKVELAHNPDWFTDLPYYLTDNLLWLANYAVGDDASLGEGSYKVVREKGRGCLYAIGYKGKGRVTLKITFTGPPFKVLSWQEL